MTSTVSLVKCATYEPCAVEQAVRDAVNLAGGIAQYIKPGSRVLVKPNMLMASGPESGVCTHPEVVRAVIRVLKSCGCQIIVGDGPSVWREQSVNVLNVYERTGIAAVCRDEGVALIPLEKRRWRQKFPLAAVLDEVDCVVNVPKFKTHSLTTLTGAIKNLFGLVSGTYKTELHKKYIDQAAFARALVDVFQEVRPAFTIVDGITAMEGDGPGTSGTLRSLGLIMAGADCVSLDATMASIMGIAPLSVPTTREAVRRKLGVADTSRIRYPGIPLEEMRNQNFRLPSTKALTQLLPPALAKFAVRFIRYYPRLVDGRCVHCGTCIKICPKQAIRMESGRITFDYTKCIACFCCSETCPAAAITVKKSMLAKMIGL